MPSHTFWYSGVSGGEPASAIQLFGLPVRTHCPLKSGYFAKSTTWAADGVASSAVAKATAQIEIRKPMNILPEIRRSARDNRAINDHCRQLLKKDWQSSRQLIRAIAAQLHGGDCQHLPSQPATGHHDTSSAGEGGRPCVSLSCPASIRNPQFTKQLWPWS